MPVNEPTIWEFEVNALNVRDVNTVRAFKLGYFGMNAIPFGV